MRTSIDFDDQLAVEVERAVELVRESQATVLRLAIRAGLPLVVNRHQLPRPEGYFADVYKKLPPERVAFENSLKKTKVKIDR